ncbi:MAG: (2Fe-2S) ferredoxin domain-containing protein [Myxococcota bacterium]|nr:(2Fe-2S) ferredoxin domain-containing protein [Myxococcota bacterium]
MDGPLFFPTRAHLLLCTGPRCARRGSARLFDDAWRALEARSIAYYKRGGGVRLTQAGCLGQCSHGPTLVAYHGDAQGRLAEAWYVGIDAPSLLRIAEALNAGDPPPEEEKRFGPR